MSPRTTEQLKEVRELSRNKILDASLKLFAERGYHNTSISQITKEAGVSKGLLYNYFEKKEDLINGVVARAMSDGEGTFQQMMALSDPKKKLRFIIDFAFKEITENKEYMKLLLSLSLQVEQFDDIKAIVKGKYESSLPLFGPLLEAVGVANPREETLILAALMDGIGLQYIVLGDALPIDDIKQYLFKRYNIA